jgi:hypothetical protein
MGVIKIVCVNNGEMDGAMDSSVNLTLGKVYEVLGDNISENDSVFNIINDIGNRASYYFGRFTTLEVARNNKLEKLGI